MAIKPKINIKINAIPNAIPPPTAKSLDIETGPVKELGEATQAPS